jgi:hypothetical protein
MAKYAIGDVVTKDNISGLIVRAIFTTIEGQLRYAVDNEGRYLWEIQCRRMPDTGVQSARQAAFSFESPAKDSNHVETSTLICQADQPTLIGSVIPIARNREIRRKFYVVLPHPESTSGQRMLHKSAPGQEQRQAQSTARSTSPRLSRRQDGPDRREQLRR